MEPDHIDGMSWRQVATNGLQIAVRVAGLDAAANAATDASANANPAHPPVVFLHGFPELSYAWRHQLTALHGAGFPVLAPDLRGYGRTGPQGGVADYRMANLARDVTGLLDVLQLPRAVVVGHDFGGALAWTLARDHADRVLGVVSLNTPYTRRTEHDLVATMLATKGPLHYMVTFQTPGVGEALLGRDVRAMFGNLLRRPALTLAQFSALPDERLRALPATLFTGEPGLVGAPFMSDAELDVFVQAYRRTGFTGALNWYRNLARNWQDTAGTPDVVQVPALMVSAADDWFLPPATTRGMERVVADLERHVVADCGHWTQQEQPQAVNALLLDWLQRRMQPLWQATRTQR